MTLTLTPMTLRECRAYVAEHHRHSQPPQGWKFGVGLLDRGAGALAGVGIAGRPVAKALNDGVTLEITRICTDGTPNACSMLYGALIRAGKALGYRRFYTYTLASEAGTSPAAAGFTRDAELDARHGWNYPGRPRHEVDLFGQQRTPDELKVRWVLEAPAVTLSVARIRERPFVHAVES